MNISGVLLPKDRLEATADTKGAENMNKTQDLTANGVPLCKPHWRKVGWGGRGM